jgi:chromosomal replication initiation ATPase DnaA
MGATKLQPPRLSVAINILVERAALAWTKVSKEHKDHIQEQSHRRISE